MTFGSRTPCWSGQCPPRRRGELLTAPPFANVSRRGGGSPEGRGLRHLDEAACRDLIDVAVNRDITRNEGMASDPLHVDGHALGLLADGQPVDEVPLSRAGA